jgi:hypothetical protein
MAAIGSAGRAPGAAEAMPGGRFAGQAPHLVN